MPELPEVEVLVRHLSPLLRGRTVENVLVRRAKVLGTTSSHSLRTRLTGARFLDVTRRGKYLLFRLRPARSKKPIILLGHLGMTGRMYLQAKAAALPKHAPVIL